MSRRLLEGASPRILLPALLAMLSVSIGRAESEAGKVRKGNQFYDQKRYEQALQLYSEALQGSPERREINYNLANTLYRLDKYPEAATELKKAAETKDQLLRRRTHFNLGNSLFKAGQFKEASEEYIRVLHEDPKDEDAKHNLELSLRKLEQQQQQQSQGQGKEQPQQERPQQKQQAQGDQQQSSGKNAQQNGGKNDQEMAANPKNMKQEPRGLSRQDAERLLQAMETKERDEQARQLQKIRRNPVQGRDW